MVVRVRLIMVEKNALYANLIIYLKAISRRKGREEKLNLGF